MTDKNKFTLLLLFLIVSSPLYPQENFYGWFVNSKEAELRALVS